MEETNNQRVSESDYDYGKESELLEDDVKYIDSETLSVTSTTSSTVPSTVPSTYIEIISEKDDSGQPLSVLEIDLIISREKGKETRRLSMNFAGIDVEKKEMVEKSVSIDRDSFERLKSFFSNLEWDS